MRSRAVRVMAGGLLAVCVAACGSTVSPTRRAAGEAVGGGLDIPDAVTDTVDAASGALPGRGATGVTGTGAPRPDRVSATGSPTADRSPIKVGILYTNNDAAAPAGIDNGNTFTSRAAFASFVAASNERGGLAGRRIEPVYVELRSSSVALQADLQAACSTFVQDNRVAVVLSAVGLFSESLSQCLAKAATPQIAGDYALGDATSLAASPSLFAPDTTAIDDRMVMLLERTSAAGRLTRADKIGVVVEGCAYNTRAYTTAVEPTAKRLGLTLVDRVESRCFEGFNDFGGLASDMAAAVLRLSSRGATKVVFVSGSFEGNLMLLFGTAAESQGYRPGYALTSAAAPAVQEANTPPNQLANAFGVGWLPSVDTQRPAEALPAAQRCATDIKAGGGIAPASPVDRYTAFSICDTFALYDAALRRTSGATDSAAIAAAIADLGAEFAAAAVHGERTNFSGRRRTGPAQGRLFAWSTACGCFDYTGSPFGLLPG